YNRVERMKRVARRSRVVVWCVAALSVVPALVSSQGARRDVRASFEGIWNSATATPLERPRQLKDKPFFTADEAAEWERQVAQSNEERPGDRKSTRLNSSHDQISYAVFCLKKKKKKNVQQIN